MTPLSTAVIKMGWSRPDTTFPFRGVRLTVHAWLGGRGQSVFCVSKHFR